MNVTPEIRTLEAARVGLMNDGAGRLFQLLLMRDIHLRAFKISQDYGGDYILRAAVAYARAVGMLHLEVVCSHVNVGRQLVLC